MFHLSTNEPPPTNGLVPFDFGPGGDERGLCIPKGCRVMMILGNVCRVPGPNGSTRIYVHPDDLGTLKTRNQ